MSTTNQAQEGQQQPASDNQNRQQTAENPSGGTQRQEQSQTQENEETPEATETKAPQPNEAAKNL